MSTIVWGLLYLTGDPVAVLLAGTPAGHTDVEQLRRDLGFDRPLPVQYLHFLANAVQGDLGKSLRSGEPAMLLVSRRIGFTAELATAGHRTGAGRGHSVGHRRRDVPRLARWTAR